MTDRKRQSRKRKATRRPQVFSLNVDALMPIRVDLAGRPAVLELIEASDGRARIKITAARPEPRELTPNNLPAELARLIE